MTIEDIVGQLEVNRGIISGLAGDLPPGLASWRPGEDRWSVTEAVNHLIDIEVEDFRAALDLIRHHPEQPWPRFDEQSWVLGRKYNERDLASSVSRFLAERDISLGLIRSLSGADLDKAHTGPGMQNRIMRIGDLLSSWVGHDLFHIKQLVLLRWDILNRTSEPFSPAYSGFYVSL